MKENRSELLLKFLEKHHALFAKAIYELDPNSKQTNYATALWTHIVQLCGDCLLLFKSRSSASVPVLVRVIMEAHVELISICKDENYAKKMESKDLRQWRSFLVSAKAGDNQYLEQITHSGTLDKSLEIIEGQIKVLTDAGVTTENIYQTFESADFREEYAIYKFLSPNVHVNIRVLFENYFVFKDEEQHFVGIKGYQNGEEENLRGIVSEFLVRSAQHLQPLMPSLPAQLVLSAREELNSIRPDGGGEMKKA